MRTKRGRRISENKGDRIMKKPQPKTEVAINSCVPSLRYMTIFASADAATEFKDFGSLTLDKLIGWYTLFVDPRFDFDEVVAYIENYDKEDKDGP